MKKERLEGRIEEALAGLEAPAASPGFTRRVLERIDDRRPQRFRHALRWAAAAAALAAVLAAGWWRSGPAASPPANDLSRRAERLRDQHRLLEAELEELRRQAEDSLAALELASGDDFDLILDLRPPAVTRPARSEAEAPPIEAVERR